MQTIQLLRATATAFFACARRALVARRPRGARDRRRPRAVRRHAAAAGARRRRARGLDATSPSRWRSGVDDGRRRDRAHPPDRRRPTASARPPTTVIRLCVVTPGELAEEAARARPRGRGAASHPGDARARRLAGGDPPWLTALRVCALYPDLMNIYADRGNLLLLRAALRVARHRLRARRRRPRRRARPRRARPLLHRRRPGPRPGALRRGPRDGQARRAARRRGARRGHLRRLRRLPAARPRLRARR